MSVRWLSWLLVGRWVGRSVIIYVTCYLPANEYLNYLNKFVLMIINDNNYVIIILLLSASTEVRIHKRKILRKKGRKHANDKEKSKKPSSLPFYRLRKKANLRTYFFLL